MRFFLVLFLVIIAMVTAAVNNQIDSTPVTTSSFSTTASMVRLPPIAHAYSYTGTSRETKASAKTLTYLRGSTRKVCQVTGEYDRERHQPTLSRTESRFGVVGTDLGASFEHEGKLFFLFGDTNVHGPATGADAIAYSTDTDPERCLALQFITEPNGVFRPVRVPGVSLGMYEVPTAGFSAHGAMYIFLMTDHSRPEMPGRSVLARSDDGGRTFVALYEISRSKFVEFAAVQVNNADVPGLARTDGTGMLLWGTGQYRRSQPYLAYVPLDEIEDRAAWKFFAGLSEGKPRWSANEAEAGPLFNQPCIGEFSVDWNRIANKWMMLYNCSNPRGINFRFADQPWGEWSESQVLFNPRVEEGYCFFMHQSFLQRQCDAVSDPGQENVPGGEYAPNIISRFTTGSANQTTVYFLMSTWNPYNVMLMRSTLILQ